MPSYWWSCTKCGAEKAFIEVTDTPGIHGFIWDQLLPSDWDQGLLRKRCPKCRSDSFKITYHFPREQKEVVFLNHLVGLNLENWLPMMWETVFASKPRERLYDFKYLGRGNTWGLNKPAVFTEGGLANIFKLYRQKTGRNLRP